MPKGPAIEFSTQPIHNKLNYLTRACIHITHKKGAALYIICMYVREWNIYHEICKS